MLDKKHFIKIFLMSQLAESGPPLGTVLGNLGVNTVKFCKDFNEFTNELPSYFKVLVEIQINENRSFSYIVKEPSVGYIISLLRKWDSYMIENKIYYYEYITLTDLFELAKFKFPLVVFKKSILILMGAIQIMKIEIKVDE